MWAEFFLGTALRAAGILALALLTLSLLRRAKASTQHALLLWALLAVLVLPGLGPIVPHWHLPMITFGAAPTAPTSSTELVRGLPVGVLEAAFGGASATVPAIGASGLGHVRQGVPWATLVLVSWALGAGLLLLRLAVGLLRARAISRRAQPLAGSPVCAVVSEICRQSGLSRAEIRISAELASPAVSGVIWPVVLLPRAAADWSPALLRAVLQHELAHVRRRDCLTHALASVTRALHWFNPLVWVALARLRSLRERAADDAVLATGGLASTYAEQLLTVALERETGFGVRPFALGMASRSELGQRVEALLEPATARGPLSAAERRGIPLVVACLLLLAASLQTPARASAELERSTGARHALGLAGTTASSSSATPLQRRQGLSLEVIAQAVGASPERVELTLVRPLQAIAEDETDRLLQDAQAAAAAVVVLDPKTGEILALTSRSEHADRDVALQSSYRPGSTMKAFTVAAAIEAGLISEASQFDCGNGGRSYGERRLRDHAPFGTLSLPQVLAVSSNVGISRIFDKLGGGALLSTFHSFHFGAAPPVQAPNLTAGALPSVVEDSSLEGAGAAIGMALTASPLQVAAAFSALANGGIYQAPTLIRRILAADGSTQWAHTPSGERVVSRDTAERVLRMLEGVVDDANGTGQRARVPGERVAGKTGTADLLPAGDQSASGAYYASFVGAVPARAPKYVILVGVETSQLYGGGGSLAAPVFARIATRFLSEEAG